MKQIIGIIVLLSIIEGSIFSQNHFPKDTLHFSIDLHKMTPEQFFSVLKLTSDTAKGVTFITVSWDMPKTWIQLDDVKYFMRFINSSEKCKCVIKVYSDFLPFDDYSTLGGQAMNLIDSYRKNESYFEGSWSCSKNDNIRARLIMSWWNALNKKK
jgi:hypothetical protein